MINQNDILAALQGGADPEALAQNFADMLNAAIAEKAKQEEEARKAQAIAETRQEKIDWMAEILGTLNDFMKEFYPEIYDAQLSEKVNAADVVDVFDQAYDEVRRMQPFLSDLDHLIHKLEKDLESRGVQEKKVLKPAAEPVDPIAAFLKLHEL